MITCNDHELDFVAFFSLINIALLIGCAHINYYALLFEYAPTLAFLSFVIFDLNKKALILCISLSKLYSIVARGCTASLKFWPYMYVMITLIAAQHQRTF